MKETTWPAHGPLLAPSVACAHRVVLVESKAVDTAVPRFVHETRFRFQLANYQESSSFELTETGAVFGYE
jgi:hypothetical protein